jgi:hypothetical protein
MSVWQTGRKFFFLDETEVSLNRSIAVVRDNIGVSSQVDLKSTKTQCHCRPFFNERALIDLVERWQRLLPNELAFRCQQKVKKFFVIDEHKHDAACESSLCDHTHVHPHTHTHTRTHTRRQGSVSVSDVNHIGYRDSGSMTRDRAID